MTEYLPVTSDDMYVEDDGTMPQNVADLADAIVGHRIVDIEMKPAGGALIALDNGTFVRLSDGGDCCAYTELKDVIHHLPSVDHIITAVQPNADYTNWHIIADFGEVMELKVGWSPGNPFYYGYGFDIQVQNA